MEDYIVIGSSPCDEDCAQVGSENYRARARKECYALIHQLDREYKKEFHRDYQCLLFIKSFPHDFGSYLEVCAKYNEDNEISVKDAYWFEANLPENWDAEALKELSQ